MKREELEQFILQNFEAVLAENLEREKATIFKINLAKLAENARSKLGNPDLGDFEKETCEKICAKFTEADEHFPIFAVLHAGDFPVRFEVKTGLVLAKILREKESVVPSKLLDEREWSLIIGFGQISAGEAQDLLRLSYRLASE